MNNKIIEVAVESYTEAVNAINKGANRLEILDNFAQGGTTPSYGTIALCVKNLTVPVIVMLRPRGGNFVYSKEEIEILQHDIEVCNFLNPYRIITGILTEDSHINFNAMQNITKLSKVSVSMHRSFDNLIERYGIQYALEQIPKLADIGIVALLSAGGKLSALDQVDNLLKLLDQCNKYNIELIVAGKITNRNFASISQQVPANVFHGRDILGNIFN